MIHLIVGKKGTGKTKMLVEQVNKAAATAKGSVICVEKGIKLTYDIKHTVRLVDTEEFDVSGFDMLYGFLCGIFAGNYDITDMFIDNVLRIGKTGLEDFAKFLDRLSAVKTIAGVNIVISVSADASELPESVRAYL